MHDPTTISVQAKTGNVPATWRALRPTKGVPFRVGALGGCIALQALLLALAGCGLGIQTSGGGSSSSGPQTTLSAFCSALHDSNYSQAYTYFSAHYKATITDPSQVPHIFGSSGTVSDCKEFGTGLALHINGNQADDQATFTLTPPPFAGQAQPPVEDPATVNFVQTGTDWQIDSIVQ